MQILPINNTDGAAGIFGSTGNQSSADFMSAMEDALTAVNDGDYLSADAALEDNAPLVDSPYTKHTTDGVTYTMSEVLFTKEELADLRLQLLKEGASPESLSQFDILADQPHGATLAQVMASLLGNSTYKFSEDDAQAITAFLGQLDPTGDLAASVLAQMREGNGAGALGLIQSALGRLDPTDTLEIDVETAMALGRGLGLNGDSLRLLANNFGGFSGLSLNAAQFDTLMTPAKNQFLQEAANRDKLQTALDKTLKPIISRARDRMEKEKEASERESRRVQQSRILIDKTVQSNSRDMLDQTLADADQNMLGKKSQMTGHAGEVNRDNLKDQMQAAANNSKGAVNAPQNVGTSRPETAAFDKNDSDNLKDSGKGKSEGWTDLFAKVEVKPVAQQGPVANPLVYAMLDNDTGKILPSQVTLDQDPMLSRQLASQVEQGVLTAMRDGATRLDLQLHPAELGTVAITLIARNGELTALIRSEKTETAEMMQRQIDTMRVNLEQQGVRVDKIEVQLENRQDDFHNSFQDLGQHNARQEEDARRQELTRLRNLAALRNNDFNAEESVLARSMHNIAQTARYAGQALHVVA